MEEQTISRFNSQSTSRTLVGSDGGISSPVYSPIDASSGQTPALSTADSKQWIDLDYLSPKILKELRRQYDPEPEGALAKGAAKVKAWARQSKLGIEIRLRRKINADRDEVTDIHLVPHEPVPEYEQRDEKSPLISELPGASNEILPELPGEEDNDIPELPDSSITSELGDTPVPSRASNGTVDGEPLPRYEPRRHSSEQAVNVGNHAERREPPMYRPEVPHHQSSSLDSIIATPTRGLALVDLPNGDNDRSDSNTSDQHTRSPYAVEFPESVRLKPLNLGNRLMDIPSASEAKQPAHRTFEGPKWNAEPMLQPSNDRELVQKLQDIIGALQQDPPKHSFPNTEKMSQEGTLQAAKDLFCQLKIANNETYETEADVEGSSPVQRKITKTARKKAGTVARRNKSVTSAKPKVDNSQEWASESGDDLGVQGGSLLRKQTLPRRLPASAGAEAIWSSLLRMQSKILGPEHPLTYQAKSDLANSRANGHVKGSEDLATLRRSKNLATQTLGIVHPWVAAFSSDLATLEELTRAQVNDGSETNEQRGQTSPTINFPSNVARRRTSSKADMEQDSSPMSERQPLEPSASAVLSTSSDIRPSMPRIVTTLVQDEHDTPHSTNSAPEPSNLDKMWNSWQPPHKPRSQGTVLLRLVFGAVMEIALKGLSWLQESYGPEQPVQAGKARVKWTCSCGQEMYDDFVERRPGAARELEAYLNRPRTLTGGAGTPTSPGSSSGSRSFMNSSFGGPPSSQTSLSNYSFPSSGSMEWNGNTKTPQTSTGVSAFPPYSPLPEPPWLLTCANEDRYTPKLAHLDMAAHKIRSDKDLALSLREHYFNVNKKWWRFMRLRGLTTIEFVQFEVHQNRFADIRKCPDMPPLATSDYSFEPGDLLPPVGSHYLLHLFKHPEDYDGELVTYLRAPKRNGRLHIGQGWGINLVEGFLADKVWMVLSGFFVLGSIAFVIAWACKRHDIQGASGVAAWMIGLVILVFGWLQAFLG